MYQLSKSKLMAYRQCPKRLWLELHKAELRDDSGSEAAFAAGHTVGNVAQKVLDPKGDGINVAPNSIGWEASAEQTGALLKSGDCTVFEAYLKIPGALALADVMRRTPDYEELRWEMIEVKAAASLKDYYRDDVAIQTYIADQSGVPLSKSWLAHIDSSFVYPGHGDYKGLFTLVDLTGEARSRSVEVAQWIEEAQAVAARPDAPEVEVGPHCHDPYDCGFCAHCHAGIEPVEDPFSMLPNLRAPRRARWEASGVDSLDTIPDGELSELQERVRTATLTGRAYFDSDTAAARIAEHGVPARFLDFETVSFAVPQWAGTRPYQQLPFQYSLHHVDEHGALHHREFLALDGNDPRRALAEQMLEDCGEHGPLFVFSASFETGVIRSLAGQFPDLASRLETLLDRIADLHPIAKECYYHPIQGHSWGLKALTPAIAPELSYDDLEGVQSGMDAGPAYLEAIHTETTPERREELRRQMLAYCKLDTLATVKLWEYFKGAELP